MWNVLGSSEPLHEPTHPRPLPGGEQASVRVLSVPLLGGVRGGFMVPVHAQERKEAFHEPQRRAGIHPPQYCYGRRVLPAPVGNADGTEPLALARSPGRRDACPTLGPPRFMVIMHAQKRMEVFHDDRFPE